ncbi:CAP domain-containing protein [Alkalihalobacterium bogoriense]|uniref:CAP domain-containing protein n=1 Tax=Alkalihalobacterium bogoriense TaxID=246272 RepID=UPI000553F929|nr:CAP domain-containing protein [Alkalihalobacterium bogoriense]
MNRLGCGVVTMCSLFLLVAFVFVWPMLSTEQSERENIEQLAELIIPHEEEQVEPVVKMEDELEEENENLEFTLDVLLGESTEEVVKQLGEPKRIDPSLYGYDWWIYYVEDDGYIQVGIEKDEVVTIYGIGRSIASDPFVSGTDYNDIMRHVDITAQVPIQAEGASFRFELNDEELQTQPLVEYNGNYIQLYFDTFTEQLSSVRYIKGDVLLKQRPYALTYRGSLPMVDEPTEEEWKAIEKGAEQQILDITNAIRYLHDKPPLEWDEKIASVAYGHSEDMSTNEFFSHESPQHGELVDRLQEGNVKYQTAGENIAANYVDAIAAVEGWLNSEGHRVNLLSDEFTHLGVGVHELYYTQNFMTPWQFLN